jgi:hypothetical protein
MAPSPHNEEVNVEDVNDETVQTQTTRRRKRRKPAPVFDESGLTKQQRRDTRMQQRMLHEDLETTTAPEQLEEIAIRNNDIFKNEVRYSREAVLDADNVFLLTQKYEQYAETLVQVREFLHLTTLSLPAQSSDSFDFPLLSRFLALTAASSCRSCEASAAVLMASSTGFYSERRPAFASTRSQIK